MDKLIILENGLVPVYTTDKGIKVVDGRELWKSLESKTDFSTWIKRRFDECDAVENEDYTSFLKNEEREIGGTQRIEYIVKLNTSKEMAMLERNTKGKQVRKYFIKVEEKYFEEKTYDDKDKKLEIQEMNARTRMASMFLKLSNVDTLSKEYKNILVSKATEVLSGSTLIPLSESKQKTYSAKEIGEIFGVSAQRIGLITNKHNLKTEDYGEWYRDKSKYSSKEVDSFRYYDSVIPALKNIFESILT